MRTRSKIVMAICAAATLAGVAAAQQTRDDGGNARLQAMVQQLTGEKTQLAADNAKLKTDLDKANAELKSLRDAQTGLERRLGQSETSLSQASVTNTRSTAALEAQRERYDAVVAEFRKTIDVLRTTEIERNELRGTLASRESALKQCVTANQKMFETGNEVLDRYEEKGCFSAMRENEPFTQNKRVQLQNLVDEYRWALEDQKLPETAQPAVAAPASAGEGT
jgi:uncharacterized protein YlxW (UPF0749 family)